MNKRSQFRGCLLVPALSLMAAFGPLHPAFAVEAADLILTNARIFTGFNSAAPSRPGAVAGLDLPQSESSLAVTAGKIVYVGDARGLAPFRGARTREYNLGGELVLPGLHDCHVHLCEGGLERDDCVLAGSKTKQEALLRLKSYAQRHPGKKHAGNKNPGRKDLDEWLKATGLPLPAVSRTPLTREDIDVIAGDRPTIIYSEDAHSLWLNSRALSLAKIDAKTKTPEAGIIEHEKDGSPNGCLREEAMELLNGVVPVKPIKDRALSLKRAVLLANSLGITSIQDAHAREDFLSTYYYLARKGELNLKVVAALHTGAHYTDKDFDRMAQLRAKYSYGNLHATSAKIFADGVIETHTAAMLEPYSNEPGNSGTLYHSPESLKTMVCALDKRGFQVHIHAIGDRAVRAALDAFADAKASNGPEYEKHRHQMAHLEVVNDADITRFKSLSVIANFQSYWAFYDPYMTDLTVPSIGPARMKHIYPVHSILATGASMAAGSDWTVSTLNPLNAMQIAITRKAPGKPFAKVLVPEERVGLKDILSAYTTGGAFANHSEETTGSIAVGKAADLIVLDRDIFAIKPESLGQTHVLKTFVDGRLVFDRSRPGDRAISE